MVIDTLEKRRSNLWPRVALFVSLVISISIPWIASHNVNSLYDTSYFLTNGLRISHGQIPYKDFILVHNPGSFLIIGLLFKIFGAKYYILLLWMSFVQSVSLLITCEIFKSIGLNVTMRNYLIVVSLL